MELLPLPLPPAPVPDPPPDMLPPPAPPSAGLNVSELEAPPLLCLCEAPGCAPDREMRIGISPRLAPEAVNPFSELVARFRAALLGTRRRESPRRTIDARPVRLRLF